MTTSLIGLALLLTAARPASAQWNIIKWLEELSGPGHFVLNGGEAHFLCKPKGDANAAAQRELDGAPLLARWLICDSNNKGVDSSRVWKQTRSFFAVLVAGGRGTNPLEYPPGEKKEHVQAWVFTGGPVYRLSPTTDLGASVGWVNFEGSTTKSFNKLIIDPYIVIRPLAKVNHDWEQAFAVRLDATWYPQGFTQEDFGAIAGPLNGKGEMIFQIGFVVNVASFWWK